MNSLIETIFGNSKASYSPPVSRVTDHLQPPSLERSSKNRTPAILLSCVMVPAFAYIGWLLWSRISVAYEAVLESVPDALQVIVLLTSITALGLVAGLALNVLAKRLSEKKWLQSNVNKIRSRSKMAVYASGSGALGISRALSNSRSTFSSSLSLVGFFHPPISAVKKGEIQLVAGGLLANAPVQDAMGHLEAAIEGRSEEGRPFQEGHDLYMNTVGGANTKIEWDIVHLGEGHTSESCHLAWNGDRSASRTGASPARTVVLVKDRSDLEAMDEVEEPFIRDRTIGVASTEPSISTNDDPLFEPSKGESSIDGALGNVVRIISGATTGSGVMIHKDGFILTCDHVLGESEEDAEVWLPDGVTSYAEIVARNPESDVALLRCIGVRDAETVEFRRAPGAQLGEPVIAAGFPPSHRQDQFKPSITHGVIRSLEHIGNQSVIRVDAEAEAGYSGGPIFDRDGRMLGMITSTIKDGKSVPPCSAVTCAISSEDLVTQINQLREIAASTAETTN